MQLVREWFQRHLSNPQVVILVLLLSSGFLGVYLLGGMLTPVLASVVIAYLLEGLVGILQRRRVPRLVAVVLVFLLFILSCLFALFLLLPLVFEQLQQLFVQLPSIILWVQGQLLHLPERFPEFISEQQVTDLTNLIRSEIGQLGQKVLSYSAASVMGIISMLVYLFLVPLMVFFFLKDKERILRWFGRFLPRDRQLASQVWREVDRQIGNYVRGKVWEILILWSVSTLAFTLLGLEFALLLGLFVGLSVLIPYIGATAMMVPVALIAYFQWGWSSQFAWAVTAYTVIQILDGNVLATLLFSEVTNLHPVAIIVAILVFGGLWGFWGVFFAIPLATLVQAVITAWPKDADEETIGDEKRIETVEATAARE